MKPVRTASVLAAAAALGVAGCSDNSSFANEERPPAPITLTAAIDRDGIRVSPARIGAGPVVIIVANLTDRTRRVTVESDTLASDSPGLRQRTAPINPRGTAQLQVDLQPGRYTVDAGGDDEAFALRVGEPRESSQNELLLP